MLPSSYSPPIRKLDRSQSPITFIGNSLVHPSPFRYISKYSPTSQSLVVSTLDTVLSNILQNLTRATTLQCKILTS